MNEILKVEHLKKYFVKKDMFGKSSDIVKAVDDISFSLERGDIFVLAGESGSGKSTVAKLILRAIRPDSGKIFFDGNLVDDQKNNLFKIRLNCQMIHQDPYDSINPRMRIGDIVSEPLEIHNVGNKNDRKNLVLDVLREVKLDPAKEIAAKYPHMLSGGQRQRVSLARCLVMKPKIIIADEPVSMLDVSIRAEILELMQQLQKKYNISFIYITHDLATAKYFGHKIGILYMGKIVETGKINDVLLNPRHPYTRALIDAIFEPNPDNLDKEKIIQINEPTDIDVYDGCRFQNKCPYLIDKCKDEPSLKDKNDGHYFACHVDLD